MNKNGTKRRGKTLYKLGSALVAMMLVVALAVGLVPTNTLAADVDSNTSDGYKISLGNNISTEYAGRIWSDKSVYSGDAEFEMFGGEPGTVQKAATEDFLVAFSALGTSQAISGQTQAPVDVVFVIDTSGSMQYDMSRTDDTKRIVNTVAALNDSIKAVMDLNPYTRVSVVAFSNTAEVLLELGRYEKGTRTSGYGNDQTTVTDYFSLSNSNGTLHKHVIPAGENRQSSSYRNVTGGTNIQMGIYTGMNVLASREKADVTTTINGTTVNRVPAIILLSDGAPTYSSNSTNWWSPSNNNNDGPGSNPTNTYYIGNAMKTLMTGAYMKEEVDRKYNVEAKLYTVGMGISGLSGHERNLAYMTLDPENTWSQDNSVVNDIKAQWTAYAGGSNITVNVGSVSGRQYTNKDYTFTHPGTNDIKDNADALRLLVDDYYDADSALEVTNVFDEIVSNITISTAQVPTEIKGSNPINDGYITYTDPIGEYMTVGDVKAIVYAGTVYSQNNVDSKTKTTDDNTTTYVFTKEIDSNVYGKQNLKDIIIQVTKDANGNETMTIKVPASVIPVRINTVELYSDDSVKSHTNNGAYPIRVVYSVNVRDDIKSQDGTIIDTTKLSQEYVDKHTNSDGTISFYSNLYTGENKVTVLENGKEKEKAAGNTTVEFEPSHTNPFYYIQEDIAIYEKDRNGNLVQVKSDTTLDDGTEYYYQTNYYNGNRVETEVLARTGLQLKKTDIVQKDGFLYRAAGSPRLNRILEFEGTKEINVTNTAEEFYAPTFQYATGSTDPYAGKYVIYLGNNGLLQMKASGLLEISKDVVIPEGLEPAVTEFEFTVDFNDTSRLTAAFPYEVLDEAGEVIRTGTIADLGTIKLSDGQRAVIRNITPGLTYKVTEKRVDGYAAKVNGTSIDDYTVDSATGTIVAGETKKAAFENTYSVQSVTVPASAGFNGTKTIVNRGWFQTDSFTFALESRRVETPMPDGSNQVGNSHKVKQVSVSGVENDTSTVKTFSFGDIVYDKPGQYEYVISEKVPTTTIPGMSYSGAMYTVVVNVEDDGAGRLKADVIMTQILDDTGAPVAVPLAEGNTIAAFRNTYSAEEVNWMPVGTKEYTDVSGKNPITTGKFHFKVEAIDATGYASGNEIAVLKSNTPLPNNADSNGVSLVTNVDTEIGYEAITFKHSTERQDAGQDKAHAKVYAYKFTEVVPDGVDSNNKLNGMTYDAREYVVAVRVYLNGENIVVEPTYPANETAFPNSTPTRVVFYNRYEPQPTTIELGGTKTLSGRNMKSGETFEFALTAANDAAETLSLPENATVTGGVDGNSVEFKFDEITFTKPGTYEFEMKEVVPADYVEGYPLLGIIYDTHSCTVTVEVEDQNGTLVAGTPQYKGGADFKNVYQVSFSLKDIVNLDGKKILTGRNIVNGEFTFAVTPENGAPMGDSFTVTSVDANGEITLLKNVAYDRAGTYTYYIKEVLPTGAKANENGEYKVNGVKYDTTEYKYVVEVVDKVVDENVEREQIGVLTVESQKLYKLHKEANGATSWVEVTEKSNDKGKNFVEIENIASGSAKDYHYVPKFKNSYETTPAERDVPVMTKILEGERAKALEANEFKFTMSVTGTDLSGQPMDVTGYHITLETDSNGPTINTETKEAVWGPIGNGGDEKNDGINNAEIHFGKINFLKEGIYTLTFAEVEGTYGYINYSEETLVARFRVSDNGRGALVADLLELHGNYQFTNVYNITSKTQKFNIRKQFTGRDGNAWLKNDRFEFEVVILDEATKAAIAAGDIVFPTVEGGIQKVVIDSNTSVTSDATIRTKETPEITIKKLGVYKFRIHEVAGEIPGVNYDSTAYDVVVTATDVGEGKMNLAVSITANGESKDQILFKNVYDTTSTELSGHDNLVIRKSFKGRDGNVWLENDKFEFTLTPISATDSAGNALNMNSSDVMVLPARELVVNNSNKAYPHFGNIKFSTPGTFVFEVKEKIPSGAVNNKHNGITYDPSIYRVTVVVVDNQVGGLAVDSVTYNKVGTDGTVQSLAFSNTYATESVVLDGETNLKVSKVLRGRNWNDEDKFEFTLEAFDDFTKNAVSATNPTVIMNKTSVTITKAEQEKTFGDIEFKAAGTYKFVIKETKGSIDNVTYDTHSMIVTVIVADNNKGGLIVADEAGLVAASPIYSGSSNFENIYTPDPVNVSFGGNKVLNGRTLKAGEFRFHIEPLTKGAPVPATRTVVNDADGIFTFGQAIYTQAGVYEYQISEMKGNLAGISYDANPVKAVVTVTYNADTGILTPTVSYVKGNQAADSVWFENTYTTAATEPVNISAVKDVTPSEGNNFAMNGGEFKFELEPATSNPKPDPISRTIITNGADGKVLFASAAFTQPGVYVYTVHEVDGSRGGITYDDSVFTITVTVEDDESVAKLKANVKIMKTKGDSTPETVGVIHFNNGYDPKETTAIIHGHKYLTGGHKDLEANEFAFELKAVDYIENDQIVTLAAETPMPSDAKNGKVIVRNEETGLFQFGLIKYDKPGTYVYEVHEVNEQKTGYTYDVDTVHKVTVKVTDLDENNQSTGELKATVEGVIDAQNNPLITFTNTYVPGTTSASISGTKTLAGRNMKVDENGKGEFEFALLDSTGAEISTATNASAGKTSTFTFESLTYDKAGTYTYTIVEKNTNLSGVTYDLETSYAVEVTVTDRDANGAATGQLKATVKYFANDAEITPEEVVFSNTYKAASTTATFGAAKVLSGRTLKANEFTFKLEALTKGAPMPETGKETAKNTADGAINFGEITFVNAGTYEYQISEVKGKDAYVTYDTNVHKVSVTVTDDLKGQLSAEVTGIEKAIFKNTYKASPVEVIFGGRKELVKVLNGRELKAEEFTFVLKDSEGNIIGEAFNNADGTFAFKSIVLKNAGSYNYVIEEKDTGANGITYDKGICYVQVEVVDDYKGNLIPTVTYGKDAKMGDSVVFTNTYKAASTSVQIGAVKTLKGRDLKASEFKFVLEDEQGNKTYAVNAADGTILFDKITYTEAGTYVYKLYEEKGTAENVTYDDKVYTITIVVEDNLNGSLEVTSQFDSSKFVFKNTYKNPEVVYTGDNTSMISMITMFVLSAGVILVALMKARKR